MKWVAFCLVLLVALFAARAQAAMTDEETYNQLARFVELHASIPADAVLVQRILSSERWATLHAAYGTAPTKKKTV